MADKKPREGNAPFATRIDPTKEGLSQDQLHYIRQVELEQWKKKTQKLRTRNVATGLAIGALVLGICILGMYANINARSESWMRWTRRPSVQEHKDQRLVPTELHFLTIVGLCVGLVPD